MLSSEDLDFYLNTNPAHSYTQLFLSRHKQTNIKAVLFKILCYCSSLVSIKSQAMKDILEFIFIFQIQYC